MTESDDDTRLGGYAHESVEWLRRVTRAGERTVQRWRATGRAPAPVVQLVRLLREGYKLGRVAKQLEGWTLDERDGKIYSPAGEGFTPGEILAIRMKNQLIAELERERRDSIALQQNDPNELCVELRGQLKQRCAHRDLSITPKEIGPLLVAALELAQNVLRSRPPIIDDVAECRESAAAAAHVPEGPVRRRPGSHPMGSAHASALPSLPLPRLAADLDRSPPAA